MSSAASGSRVRRDFPRSSLTGLGLAVFLVAGASASLAPPEPGSNVCVSPLSVKATTPIDSLFLAGLPRGQPAPALCSDAVFLRRAFLDVAGKLPTLQEAREFLADPRPEKRAAVIDRLLAREEYADCWAMKWGDLLRIKAEFPINLWPNAAQAYDRWVRAALAGNLRYDAFARELLTSSGSNFRVGPVNFYRAVQDRSPEGLASAVALTFMGTRTDRWPRERLEGMASFFSQVAYKPTHEWKEEIVYWDRFGLSQVTNNVPGTVDAKPRSRKPVFPDGQKAVIPEDRDPREIFADWLIQPGNHWFTRNIVNRAWAWLVGRGLIHEPDDIRDDSVASNPALLAYLERQLVSHQYDLKHLFRVILNSGAYQAAPGGTNLAGATYAVRRLEAEVMIDIINQVTGSSDLYTSAIPEPFTYIPEDEPAVCLPDGSITSPFLALFGRSARTTGMENERDNRVLPAQWLHLLNSSHIQRKLEKSVSLKALMDSPRPRRQKLDELYLLMLTRHPTDEEARVALEYVADPKTAGRQQAREGWQDLAWALMNSMEFVYRH